MGDLLSHEVDCPATMLAWLRDTHSLAFIGADDFCTASRRGKFGDDPPCRSDKCRWHACVSDGILKHYESPYWTYLEKEVLPALNMRIDNVCCVMPMNRLLASLANDGITWVKLLQLLDGCHTSCAIHSVCGYTSAPMQCLVIHFFVRQCPQFDPF